jgi:hypothetical protein
LRRLTLALAVACCPLAAFAAEPAASFTSHWEDCENFAEVCYGYRLEQKGDTVCGSLTRAAKTGDVPKQHGHIRGRVAGAMLIDVAVCGVESRTPCPAVMNANRRGLLLCGDELFETGGRRYTCEGYPDRQFTKPYRRVSPEAFDKRFGPEPPSLCAVPVVQDGAASAGR